MAYFAVLTAESGVSDDDVTAVSDQLSETVQPVRLSDQAVEIAITSSVSNISVPHIDVNIVAAAGRRKKLLIADMDSTIIPVECIDELADFAGVKDRVADITERAMQGQLDFEAAIDERVGLLKGLSETVLQTCFDERISLNPGASTLVKTMANLGAETALVSGGFDFFTSRVAAEAGFHINQANHLLTDAGHLTGEVRKPVLGQQAKLDALNIFCKQGNFTPAEVIAVGDGANDAAMVKVAGIGVAYRAKPALRSVATACLDYSDLTALLSLQGIKPSEYAS